MFILNIVVPVGFAAFAMAAPTKSHHQAITDAQILNYALTLEHLEDTFYRQGMANYTQSDFIDAGFPNPFYANLMEVASDERTHVEFLTNALEAAGAPAVAECTYNFPSTDVQSFVALASVLEGVGVTAYLGAAASIMNKDYLTAAGSILTVESRHSSYIRSALMQSPFPQAFDVLLDFNQVYTLAAPFIASCPPGPELPVRAFPTLTLKSDGPIMTGATITLMTDADVSMPLYGAFITVTGPIIVSTTPADGGVSVTVPGGIAGQSYVVLTRSAEMATDDCVIAGPAIVEVAQVND